MNLRGWNKRSATAIALATAAVLMTTANARSAPHRSIELKTLSNRADLVSGGAVLVEAVLPRSTHLPNVRFGLNGKDITRAFARRAGGRVLGVVAGLKVGANTLTARGPSGAARLTITNHRVGGPIFSGPQIPWWCLEGARDTQCNRPVVFTWYAKSSVTGLFGSFDPDNPPSDVATTTTDQSKTVPYIVRLETGNMDRSQYRIAVLADPKKRFTRWTGPPAWNHKVFVLHGGGCANGHSEGAAPDVLNDNALKRGFAVMSTALIVNSQNCNLVVQAESLMMAKEHLIETYGDIRYLFGSGGSGGAIAQLHMANAYPGLYDGLVVGATMPDVATPAQDIIDCVALLRYLDDASKWAPGVAWAEPSMAAAMGKASSSVCRAWAAPAGPTSFSLVFKPSNTFTCLPSEAADKVYDPARNPKGIRCALQDYMANVFGRRRPSLWGPVERKIGAGFANRPYDNVGVQYGLRALRSGGITPAQFVDLNAKAGAVDIDFEPQSNRVKADPAALAAPYRSGFVNEANNLDLVPIIDKPGGFPGDRYEIHDIYKSWSLRARLDASTGGHRNHALWYGPAETGRDAFGTMDAWLAAIEADDRNIPREKKIVEDRPNDAEDGCDFPDRATCDTLFGPGFGSVRWGAGDEMASDVVKCRLKPLVRSDYAPARFTDDQWTQLRRTYPSGVCDWTKSGVGQQRAIAWQTYEDGPGGRRLGAPPVSKPLTAKK